MSETLREKHQRSEAISKAEREAALRGKAELYSRAFSTPDGAAVLEDLAEKIGLLRATVASADAPTLHHLEGQRAVLVYIFSMLARASEDERPTITLPIPLPLTP